MFGTRYYHNYLILIVVKIGGKTGYFIIILIITNKRE